MSTSTNGLSVFEIERLCHSEKAKQSRWYYLHRRVSTPITALCFRLGVAPSVVSVSMVFVGLLGNLAIVPLNLPLNLAGLLLIYLAFLLDKVDGDLARLQGRSSPRAMILDYAYHRMTLFTFYGALGGHAYLLNGEVLPLVAGFITGFLANYAADAGAYPFRIYAQKVLCNVEPWTLADAPHERRLAHRQSWWKILKVFSLQVFMVFAAGLVLCVQPQWLTPLMLAASGCLLIFIVLQHYVYFDGGMEAELAFIDQCMRRQASRVQDDHVPSDCGQLTASR